MENSINRSSNATSVLNGFLFQIDVAIFLFIEYIDDIEIMRVEGKKEDIEITLKNKNKYMVQVKSQYNAQTKNKNIMARLRKALRGLIKSDSEEVERLIYATNFVDPLNNNDPEFLNYSYILRKNYIDLSDSSRKVIEEEINKIIESKHIDYNKIWLVRIPFSGEDEREKHKFIHEQVKFFLKGIYDGLDYYKFVKDWESILMNNGANISTKSITRNDMKTNLIFVCLQGKQPYIKYSSLGVNENDFDEACSRYNEYIDRMEGDYEIVSKINSLYYGSLDKNKDVSKEQFVIENSAKLVEYIFPKENNTDGGTVHENRINTITAQIIAMTILRNMWVIDKINERIGI